MPPNTNINNRQDAYSTVAYLGDELVWGVSEVWEVWEVWGVCIGIIVLEFMKSYHVRWYRLCKS